MSTAGQKVLSGSIWRITYFISTIVMALFLTPFILRSLGDKNYGFWIFVGTFIGYYQLLDAGLSIAVTRYLAKFIGEKDQQEVERVFHMAMKIFTAIGVVAALVSVAIVALAPWLIDNPENRGTFQALILILGLSTALTFPVRPFVSMLYADLEFRSIPVIQLSLLLLKSALIVAVLWLDHGLIGMAWVTLAAAQAESVWTFLIARKKFPGLLSAAHPFDRRLFKDIFGYGWYAFIAQVATNLKASSDSLIIAWFLNLSAVAHYRIATMFVDYYYNLMLVWIGTVIPHFSQNLSADDRQQVNEQICFLTKISTGITAFIGFGMAVWGKAFIVRWVGADYLDSYSALVVLAVGYSISLLHIPAIGYVYAASKHKALAQISLIEGVATILISMALIGHFGILGVAYATLVSVILLKGLVFPAYFCRISGIRARDYTRAVLRTLLSAGVALVVPAVLSYFFSAARFDRIILLVMAAAAAYVPVFWMVEFKEDEKEVIYGYVRPYLPAKVIGALAGDQRWAGRR